MKDRIAKEGQNSRSTATMPHLCMTIKSELVPQFAALLSEGFSVIVKVACSINDLLNQEFDIPQSYIDDRIQTIFLNGKAVDDSNSASLQERDTLALSAAMPGMVGSTFRKGGVLAGMRSQISHMTDPSMDHGRQIEVKLKLFNLVAKELGPAFLHKGVIVGGKRLQSFVLQNSENLKSAGTAIYLNNEKKDAAELLELNWQNKQVFLQVAPEKLSK